MRPDRLAIVFVALPLCGCNLLLPEGGYLRHRLDDVTEAAHADVSSSFALGALVNVGPAVLGAYRVGGLEFGERLQFGLGGMVPMRTANDSAAVGLVVPLEWAMRESPSGEPLEGYRDRYPGYASVGLDLGFILGLGLRVDVVELADCIVGIVGVDLLDDDEPPPGGYPRDEESPPPEEETPAP